MQSYEDAIKEVIEQINYAKKFNAEITRQNILLLQAEDYKKIARATKCTVRFRARFENDNRAYYIVDFKDDGTWRVTYCSPNIVTENNFEYDGTKENA